MTERHQWVVDVDQLGPGVDHSDLGDRHAPGTSAPWSRSPRHGAPDPGFRRRATRRGAALGAVPRASRPSRHRSRRPARRCPSSRRGRRRAVADPTAVPLSQRTSSAPALRRATSSDAPAGSRPTTSMPSRASRARQGARSAPDVEHRRRAEFGHDGDVGVEVATVAIDEVVQLRQPWVGEDQVRRGHDSGAVNIWPMRIALPNGSRTPKSMP